uniref:Uncharacterized protein n=1 Tax=Cannabis sativa TaxID=3483 RepID=A0A803QV23_CANSA
MHFTKCLKKVVLGLKMVSNMGHLSGKKNGMLIVQILTGLPLWKLRWKELMRLCQMLRVRRQ